MIRLTLISDLSKLEKRQAWRESYNAAHGSTREERDRNASVVFFDRIYGDDVIGDAAFVDGCTVLFAGAAGGDAGSDDAAPSKQASKQLRSVFF